MLREDSIVHALRSHPLQREFDKRLLSLPDVIFSDAQLLSESEVSDFDDKVEVNPTITNPIFTATVFLGRDVGSRAPPPPL